MAEKWIQEAIKRPGALREKMGAKEGEKIPKGKISAKISAAKRTLLKQLVLARTLGEMK